MPMLPSISSACGHRPAPGSRSKIERRSAVAPFARLSSSANGATSTPSAGTPRPASSATSRPGPHPRSSVGPEAAVQDGLVHGVGRRAELRRVEQQGLAGVGVQDQLRGRVVDRLGVRRAGGPGARVAHAGTGTVAPARRATAAKRDAGAAAATAGTSSIVSTSRSTGSIRTLRPASVRRPSCTAPVRVRGHRHVEQQPVKIHLARAAEAQRPEAAVLGQAERRVLPPRGHARLQQRTGHLRRVHPDEQRRAGITDRGLLERGGQAPIEAAADLGHDGEAASARRPTPDLPPELTPEAKSVRRQQLPSVSANAAPASSAPCSGVNGGVSRVFTRPGTGAFAMTIRVLIESRPSTLGACRGRL